MTARQAARDAIDRAKLPVLCLDCGATLPKPECWCGGEICPQGATLADGDTLLAALESIGRLALTDLENTRRALVPRDRR